ncbi:DUF3883 domain-containing protein [Acetobacter fabarum]|uniref:sacsin N-terminal ATP-binding-like domain-containing protein n=1 Tax=Acetobacter fabarum TaxID=483199 RepID=UPI00312B5B37
MNFQAVIDEVARRKVAGFTGTIDEDGDYYSKIYAGSASMGESIASDYHGRFLIELIQNANDVHPDNRSDGAIKVVLDLAEGAFGVLYVANSGTPFLLKNVDALCDMGLSSKPPGESIGNKGLGFRSVHHVTDVPHVFSRASEGAADIFDGFCFRFAGSDDLDRLVDNPRHRELAKIDLPLFHIPVWVSEQPETVRRFARQGYSSVIALPLRSADAVADVRREFASVRASGVPLLLFLSRLARLTVKVLGAGGTVEDEIILERMEDSVEIGGQLLSVADLGNEGTYLIARRSVPEIGMLGAIQNGIETKQLHKHWEKWGGDGEVALAVRLDAMLPQTRLYTYLPMGTQAVSPFNGFLHGTFFPNSSRTAVDGSIRLNALLAETAAALAAATIATLVSPAADGASPKLDKVKRASAVVDLLAWEPVDSLASDVPLEDIIVEQLVTILGVERFSDAPIVPALVHDAEPLNWFGGAMTRHWTEEGTVFGADAAALHAQSTGVSPIWPGLGPRIDRLTSFLTRTMIGYVNKPKVPERVALVVAIARDIASDKQSTASRWNDFYHQLPGFLNQSGAALAGAPILLDADGNLRKAMTPAVEVEGKAVRRKRGTVVVSVFFPPARRGGDQDEDNFVLPASLANNFAFLSHSLDWYGDLSDAREYLEKHKLVLEFDRDVILVQLSRIVRADGRNATRTAGLRMAFQIWRGPRTKGRAFKLQAQHRFMVPTVGGEFVDARHAVFSRSWPDDTLGPLIHRFIGSAPTGSYDIDELAARRLADRNHYCFKGSSLDLWTEFLIELGVQKGLHPIRKTSPASIPARRLRDFSFCEDLGIPDRAAQAWRADIIAHVPYAFKLKSSTGDYILRGDIFWLPGQGDVDRFTRDCLEHFAQLVIAWLDAPPAKGWTIDVHHHHFIHDDARDWPTPLRSFLRSSAWIPADQPSTAGTQHATVRPCDIWRTEDGERFPPFLRRPTIPVMRALERATKGQAGELHKRTGMSQLFAPGTLVQQAEFLAAQFGSDGFDRYFERHFLNLYHRGWRQLATRYSAGRFDPAGAKAPSLLVVREGSGFGAVDLAQAGSAAVYVRDTRDETAVSLAEAAEVRLFDAGSGDAEAMGRLMRVIYGDRVRLLSGVGYELIADGQTLGEGETVPVISLCPRLRLLVAVALEALKGVDYQRLPADRQGILGKLERLLVQRAGMIRFKFDGVDIEGDVEHRRAFSLKLDNGHTVVVTRISGGIDWQSIDDLLPSICEAIEQPSLEPNLRLLLSDIRYSGAEVDQEPDLEEEIEPMADRLRLGTQARSVVRDTLGASIERQSPWLKAILHAVGGQEAVDAFEEDEAAIVQDVSHLRSFLSPWLAPVHMDIERVLDACRTSLAISELREALGMDFAVLNHALDAVGEAPDIYPEVHAGQLIHFIRDNNRAILDCLRAKHADALARFEPTPGYSVARDALYDLRADPDWLMRFRDVPEQILGEHVDAWLVSHGAPTLEQGHLALEPLDDVRDANAAMTRKLVAAANPLVRAWCTKNDQTVPAPWLEGDAGCSSMRAILDKGGAFEFQALSEISMRRWLVILEAWPVGMPESFDRDVLGIGDQDLDVQFAKARAEADARKREARLVSFNGRKIDPEEADWQSVSDELASSLSSKLLGVAIGSAAKLKLSRTRERPRSCDVERRQKPPPPPPRAPSQKTDMIGRLGEMAVYHWLRRRLPDQDIDAAWMSGNARPITNREGSDSLGYDFEIGFRGQRWQIEVKASLADPCAFILGETEVRAGRSAARPRSGTQYWIAYVSNIGNPSQARVEMLPNPMSESGESVLNLLGEGLRYGFVRLA